MIFYFFKYPFEYEITNPLSIEEQEILNPRKIKSNAPEAYNMREPNASTLKDNDILLVKNTDALRKFVKFILLFLNSLHPHPIFVFSFSNPFFSSI